MATTTYNTLEFFIVKSKIYPINWIEKSIYQKKVRIQSNLLKHSLLHFLDRNAFSSLPGAVLFVSFHWLSSSCPLICPLILFPLKIQFLFITLW